MPHLSLLMAMAPIAPIDSDLDIAAVKGENGRMGHIRIYLWLLWKKRKGERENLRRSVRGDGAVVSIIARPYLYGVLSIIGRL